MNCERFIAEGGFGKVYIVSFKNDTNKRMYALKLMRISQLMACPLFVEGVKTERYVLEMLIQYPSIVTMRYAFRTDRYLAIMTDFLKFHDLRNRMYDTSELSEKDTSICAAEIAYALGILHEALFGPTGVTEETKKMNIIAGKIDYPDHISQNARDFINKLLIPDPSERLGSRGGLKELKEHPFLASIDWMKVATRTNDPVKKFTIPLSFEPEVLIEASESSSLHFDLSDNTENIEMLFENFHYAHPSEVQEANGTLSTACQRFLPIPPSVYFCVPNKGPHLKYSVWLYRNSLHK
ncbi:hypothetical protein ACOME3_003771 [Neoechinorhynchus agilis]